MERIRKGTVEDVITRVTGPWKTAHVWFENEESANQLKDTWSITYFKDLCRIASASATRDLIETRNRFTLKLTNLSFGTTAFDL